MSSSGVSFPRWLLVLTAQLLVGIAILNIYFIRKKAMDESAVSMVSFDRVAGGGDYQESETRVVAPGKAEVNIRSTAGSGGYALMVVDVIKNEKGRLSQADLSKVPRLSGPEMQARLELPVIKYGVTAERPVIKSVEPRPGAAQVYSGIIQVDKPGDYTVVYAQFRPWQPETHQIYYVVHVRAD